MTQHPYQSQPAYAFWSRSIAGVDPEKVDPVVRGQLQISMSDRVATAGSCFAQHIAKRLVANGFNFFDAEKAHPIVPAEQYSSYNYGVFSARFGNIYTSRQLLQLFLRAYGEFQPKEDRWTDGQGNLIDPFRPRIQPNGFQTESEYIADRMQHFSKVRQLFSELDVFIFTLGLTECWVSTEDGAAYPLCPGVSGGSFDSSRYRFVNLGVDDVTNDMLTFIDRLRTINPKARIILTVSPVPMVATAEDRHVLVSNTYSKSVLRVAAEIIAKGRPGVAYFPSYEIISGSFSQFSYYDRDSRSVTDAGVNHVMKLFLKYYAVMPADLPQESIEGRTAANDPHTTEMARLVDLNCDEVALDS
jgi:GSCFA family